VTYSPNRVRGQWAAHGRYIARESAVGQGKGGEVGFSAASEGINIAKTLAEWQTAGDPRLFKLIISPEFGERLDLQRHTRELLSRVETDLGVGLEWVAVAHFNTGHPHVHIALRGRTGAGPLRLDRDYIKSGIRNNAEELCTAQLGFRTELDALEAERREVDSPRITSLDRRIAREAFSASGDGSFDIDSLPSLLACTS
jgi:type IV secretory pathway VirD2 relaxase